MTYVIGEACVDVLDRACVEECPVDCIYEGERMLYIHPDECVDCGACEPVCPVEAIYYEDDLPVSGRPMPGRTCASSPSRCPAGKRRSDLREAPASWAWSVPTRRWWQGFRRGGSRACRGGAAAGRLTRRIRSACDRRSR